MSNAKSVFDDEGEYKEIYGLTPYYKLTPYFINRAMAYWREGLDTNQIASRLEIKECHIYNSLDRIKSTTTQDKGA